MVPTRRSPSKNFSETKNTLLPQVRKTVRSILENTPEYEQADPELRRSIAQKMVHVSLLAADLLDEDRELTERVQPPTAPMVQPMAAGDQLGLQATREAGRTVQSLREAIDFPTFVTDLINGVFKAITTSSIQQLESINDLLSNVSVSSSTFAARQISDADAAVWALQQFSSFLEPTEENKKPSMRLRADQDLSMHYPELKETLEASDNEVAAIDEDELMQTLIPLVKRKLGRQRQTSLATLIMMGLNRIVVDQGRLHASMDMRVDTRSTSEQREKERSDFRFTTSGSAKFGVGAWGASARMGMSVGRIQSDEQLTKEEIATRAGLRSSVDLVFHSEPVSLERITDAKTASTVRNFTPNPKLWVSNAADVSKGSLLPNQPQTQQQQFGKIPDITFPKVKDSTGKEKKAAAGKEKKAAAGKEKKAAAKKEKKAAAEKEKKAAAEKEKKAAAEKEKKTATEKEKKTAAEKEKKAAAEKKKKPTADKEKKAAADKKKKAAADKNKNETAIKGEKSSDNKGTKNGSGKEDAFRSDKTDESISDKIGELVSDKAGEFISNKIGEFI